MLKRLALLALAAASPALADDPMSAAEFEAYVTGKTLFYSHLGVEYGVEQYLPGRRVKWAFLDGDCRDGRWYQQDDMICFTYEGDIARNAGAFSNKTTPSARNSPTATHRSSFTRPPRATSPCIAAAPRSAPDPQSRPQPGTTRRVEALL